jgi:hypothetical protein
MTKIVKTGWTGLAERLRTARWDGCAAATLAALASIAWLGTAEPAQADPPDHAPAYGYRHKERANRGRNGDSNAWWRKHRNADARWNDSARRHDHEGWVAHARRDDDDRGRDQNRWGDHDRWSDRDRDRDGDHDYRDRRPSRPDYERRTNYRTTRGSRYWSAQRASYHRG